VDAEGVVTYGNVPRVGDVSPGGSSIFGVPGSVVHSDGRVTFGGKATFPPSRSGDLFPSGRSVVSSNPANLSSIPAEVGRSTSTGTSSSHTGVGSSSSSNTVSGIGNPLDTGSSLPTHVPTPILGSGIFGSGGDETTGAFLTPVVPHGIVTTPAAKPLLSDEFSLTLLDRSVAVRELFQTNVEVLSNGSNTSNPLKDLFRSRGDSGISILKDADILTLYRFSSLNLPTLCFVPLVVGFTTRVGFEVSLDIRPQPYSWSDLGRKFPLCMFILHSRPGSDFVLIYVGRVGPSENPDQFFGFSESEVGTEFTVRNKYGQSLIVVVPDPSVTRMLMPKIIQLVPGIEIKVPTVNPIPSKSLYVHQDNIFVWEKYRATAPTTKAESESLFILRNTQRLYFICIQNSPYLVEVNPLEYVQRLIAISLLPSNEVDPVFHLAHGLYSNIVRHLRIMHDPAVLSRFIRGDWPGTFQLHKLSLYHFLPITHKGFDYDTETTDIFLSLKGLNDFCTWLEGDHWVPAFRDKILLWQTTAPWTSQEPWVLHTCFEQAIAYWVYLCNGHGCDFKYQSHLTALDLLDDQLTFHLKESRLKEVRDSYNRILSKIIVYPYGTSVPTSAFAGRAKVAASDSSALTSNYSELTRTTTVTSDTSESGKKRGRDQQELKNQPTQSSSKAPPKIRYCYANLASIFKINVTPKYSGGCMTPDGKTCGATGGNTHFTPSNLPSLSDVISTIRSFAAINPSTTSLVEQLEEKNK